MNSKKKENLARLKSDIVTSVITFLSCVIILLVLYFFGFFNLKLCASLIFIAALTCIIYLGLCIEN